MEMEKVEIFLKDLSRKLDLLLEAQAAPCKKVDTKVDVLIVKKEEL